MSFIESYYRNTSFDDLKAGIAVYNPKDMSIDTLNDTFATIHGYDVDELIGMPVENLFISKHMHLFQVKEKKFDVSMEDSAYETLHRKKDGSTFSVFVQITAIKDENGKIKQKILNVTDISRYKKARQELKKHELEYRALSENIPDVIVRYDMNIRRVYVNKEWEHINGISTDEAIGKSPIELSGVISHQAKWFHEKLKNVVKHDKSDEWDFEFINLYGGVNCYSIRAIPEYDKLGKITGVLTTARDITQRKELEEEKISEQMRSYFESKLVGMAITSPQKKWLRVNKKLSSMLGYTHYELKSMTWEELTHSDDLNGEVEEYTKMLKGEIDEYMYEKRFIHKSGTMVFAKLLVHCVRNNDKSVDYVLTLIEDITERICAKEALYNLNETLEKRVKSSTNELNNTISRLDLQIAGRKHIQKQLASREQMFRGIVENLPGFTYTFQLSSDGKSKFLYVSDSIYDIYGINSEDVKEDSEALHALTHPDDKDYIIEAIKESAQNMTPFHIETRIIKDLTIKWVEFRSLPQKERDGTVLWNGIALDITERKEIEEKNKRSEQLMRTVIDATPDWIFIKDKQHRYLLANEGYANALHLSREDFIGKNDLELGFPEELVKGNPEKGIRGFWADDRLVLESKEIQVYHEDPATIDGEIHTFHTIKAPLLDENNEAWGVLAFARDLTAAKRDKEYLQRTKAKLNAVISTIPDLVWVKDKDGVYLMCNTAFENFFGAECDEIIGKTDYDFISKEQADFFRQKDREAMEAGEMRLNEEEIVFARNNQYALLETRKIPVYNGDEFMGVLGIGRDITKQKEAELALIESQTYLQTIINNEPECIKIIDADGRLVFMNPAGLEMIEATLEQVQGKEVLGVIVEKYRDDFIQMHKRVLEGETAHLVFETIGFKGKRLWLETTSVPMQTDKGRVLLGVTRDITERKKIEAELKKQHFALTEAQRLSHIGSWELDFETNKLSWSDEVFNIFEIDKSSFGASYEAFQEVVHPDDREMVELSFNESVQNRTPYMVEHRLLMKDGRVKYVQERGEIKYEDDGRAIYSIGTVQDITEAKKQAELLVKRELEFRTLANNLPDNIARFGIDGTYLYINPVHERTLGIEASKVLGKRIGEEFPDHKEVIKAIEHVATTGEAIINIRQVVPSKNGDIEIHEVSLLPERDASGKILSVLGIGRDVTQQLQIQTKLQEQEKQFRTIMENTPDTVARYDKECIRTYANPSFAKIAGKSVDELVGKKPTSYFDTPKARAYEEVIQRVYESSKEEEFELSWQDADGVMITSLIKVVPERDSLGKIKSVLATGRDVTKLKEFESEISKQKDFQESLLKGVLKAGLSLSVIENGKYIYTNNYEYAKEYGYDIENFSETKPDMLTTVHPDDKEKVMQMYKKRLAGEDVPNNYTVKVLRANGEVEYNDISVVLVPNTDPVQTIVVTKDVTEQKNIEKRIEFMAHHDALTGLPNRLLAQDRAEQTLASAKSFEKKAAILFIDLDGFKTINDSLGHAIGDTMLKQVSLRLQGCISSSDTLSRQGGDEFLLILPDVHNISEVKMMADKVIKEFKKPFHIHTHTLSTSASIGIAIYPEHGENFEQLLQGADAAMYKAKETGKNNYCFFTQQMKHNLIGLFQMQNDLKKAIENKEFELHYQPQVDLRENRVVGAEALIRWQHPTQGMIPPMSFISIAESSGLIVQIGEWVIMEACRQAAMWNKEGKELIVAVNISAVQFQRGNLEAVVKNALAVTGLNPKYLELELTESILINDTENILETVKVIKELGIQLSIDDFGTGYSSLAYLKRFAVDKLKIDQSFVRDILKDKEDASIVRTIIQMAKSFNLRSIAEGVENQEVLDLICEFGCDEVQGYHFAKPMSSDDFNDYYEQASF